MTTQIQRILKRIITRNVLINEVAFEIYMEVSEIKEVSKSKLEELKTYIRSLDKLKEELP